MPASTSAKFSAGIVYAPVEWYTILSWNWPYSSRLMHHSHMDFSTLGFTDAPFSVRIVDWWTGKCTLTLSTVAQSSV